MNKKIFALTLLMTASLILSGCFALAEPEESSGTVVPPTLAAADPVEAEPVEADADPTESEPAAADPDAYPGPAVEQPTAVPQPQSAYPGGEPPTQPAPAEPLLEAYPGQEELSADLAAGTTLFEIDPARSEARFTINEVLRGAPTTVVGVSNNMGGQIALNLADPSTSQVGTIVINARDFATDNDFRNRAIANEILLTNQFEFITFEPTAIAGLPGSVEVGQTYPLQITGNLTIADQTREATFDVEVTPLSENELRGLAALDILYADFGLTIPFARSVESVEDNVLLELDFVAVGQ
ncbi:MAG: YceI family protein [Candidatus Promineifilaceae bacterium]|nr:YceI family protein [Candidatus Promineifilaceae bacterium]